MVRKKIDNRIRVLIENGVALGHRTMLLVVGDKSRDQVSIFYLLISSVCHVNPCMSNLQVVILHHMLSKATVKVRPSVLWCYKKDLGFSRYIYL